MPEVRLELSAERFDRLEAECELMGFDGPEEYLAWLVENRAEMGGDGGRNRILSAYARRVRELEARLEAVGGGEGDDGGDGEATDPAVAGDASTAGDPTAPGDLPAAGKTAASGTDDDGGTGGEEGLRADLAPATVRLEDDALAEVADELQRARDDRMDEVVRRAVAKTRRQLGEGTETGVDYRSSAALGGEGPRPGSEITDLDALEVPGYDDELVERRRTAVGAALALLKDRGRAKRSDFLGALYEEYPAGYSSPDGWWSCVKRGLRQVDRVDGAGDGSRVWRYRDVKGRVRVVRD